MKWYRRMFILLGTSIALLTMLLIWAAGGVQGPRRYDGTVHKLTLPPDHRVPDGDVLRVVVWNIAWGYGPGSTGTGRRKPSAHFERTMDRMGRLLASVRPDVVILQEVDFDSTRSHRTNQAERLARQAGLRYVAPAVSWSANWVPFPYWPPSDHFGHMSSGGAVLSRYPLSDNRVELLPKPTDNPWWYNLFYLFRYVHQVQVDFPGGGLTVVNAHLEAFDPANRINQAYRVRETLEKLDAARIVFGADLNAVPPESPVRHGYPDEPNTDHREDETVATLRSARTVNDTLPAATFTSTPSAWFTFPADAPSRKLDYIFASDGFEVVSTRVMTEAEAISDHLPLFAELRLK